MNIIPTPALFSSKILGKYSEVEGWPFQKPSKGLAIDCVRSQDAAGEVKQ